MDIKKKLITPLLSLVLVSVVMLLSIVTYFNQSFGWFSANKDVDSAGAQVHMEKEQAKAEYYAYSYNSRYEQLTINDGQSNNANFVNIVNDSGYFELSPFDTIFRARNRYTAGIIKIHLYDIEQAYTSGGTILIKLTRDTSIQSLVNGATLDYSSNLFRFLPLTRQFHDNTVLSAITNKNLTQSNQELPDLFEAVYNYANSHLSSSYSFLSGSAGSYTELNEITLQVQYSAQDVSNNQLDIIIYVFYNEAVISSLPSGISGTAVIGQVDDISSNIGSMSITLT